MTEDEKIKTAQDIVRTLNGFSYSDIFDTFDIDALIADTCKNFLAAYEKEYAERNEVNKW